MSREAYSPPDPAEWYTHSVKLILFPVSPQHREKREWWRELTDKEPDESVRKKDEGGEAGLIGTDRRLTVTVNPVKMEIEIEPVQPVPPVGGTESLPNLGPLSAQAEQLFGYVLPWLGRGPQVKRVGFAAGLAFPAKTHAENYLLLDRMLQTVDVDPDSSDFQYRVNRKAKSASEPVGMLLNRIMTWTSQKVSRQLLTLSGEGFEAHEVGGEIYFTGLSLDFNTDQAHTDPFPPDVLGSLCRELAELAIRTVERGDVRT